MSKSRGKRTSFQRPFGSWAAVRPARQSSLSQRVNSGEQPHWMTLKFWAKPKCTVNNALTLPSQVEPEVAVNAEEANRHSALSVSSCSKTLFYNPTSPGCKEPLVFPFAFFVSFVVPKHPSALGAQSRAQGGGRRNKGHSLLWFQAELRLATSTKHRLQLA